ncbi:aromatic ring-hydroxylating dioxygenase subunit alpha [Novosphingobium sp.]|uniref:aromatic ring-hydroxylating dioxygenase subunit alpha n=1 Tax=Novosphingobium sp. TaxID=1874826 RepID=UPI002FDF7180
MWLRNNWYVCGHLDELGDDFVERRICGERVVLFRTAAGQITALEDRCPHRMVPLSAGFRDHDEIVCGYHGMRFNADGRCTDMPGRERIHASAKVRTFPTVARWNLLWIWMGEPSLADLDAIPDFWWLGSPDWQACSGYLTIGADYRLLNDNLLDLSHESFLHPGSIGNGKEEIIARFPVAVTAEMGRVEACRLMNGIEVPPAFGSFMGLSGHIDRVQTAIYLPPGINLTVSTMRSSEHRHPKPYEQRTLHLLTPEDEDRTHYFFVSSRNYRLNDAALDDAIIAATYHVFGEDRAMLEKQQAALSEQPDMIPRVAWEIDEAPVLGRRLLQRLLDQEQNNCEAVHKPATLIAVD